MRADVEPPSQVVRMMSFGDPNNSVPEVGGGGVYRRMLGLLVWMGEKERDERGC